MIYVSFDEGGLVTHLQGEVSRGQATLVPGNRWMRPTKCDLVFHRFWELYAVDYSRCPFFSDFGWPPILSHSQG